MCMPLAEIDTCAVAFGPSGIDKQLTGLACSMEAESTPLVSRLRWCCLVDDDVARFVDEPAEEDSSSFRI